MKNPKGGRVATDYVLTMDTAKELSMVERNVKGKQARQYFIQAEKALRQIVEQPPVTTLPAPTVEPVLLQLLAQQTQLLTDQQQTLNRLRADVDVIMAGHKAPPATKVRSARPVLTGPALPPPHLRGPASLRQSINGKVNQYCERWDVSQGETYNYLYKRLHEVYGVNVYRLQRSSKESILDALERYGHLDRLDSLVSAELDYTDQ